MRFLILKPKEFEALDTELGAETPTKRHEFIVEGDTEVFVVFESEEYTPFWRREDGIRFVYTNLSYEAMLSTAEVANSFLNQITTECTGAEFEKYYREALENHKANRGIKSY